MKSSLRIISGLSFGIFGYLIGINYHAKTTPNDVACCVLICSAVIILLPLTDKK